MVVGGNAFAAQAFGFLTPFLGKADLEPFVLNGGMKAMRFAARALVAICLILCCRVVAAQSDSAWWSPNHPSESSVSQPQGLAQSAAPLSAVAPSTMGPVQHEVLMPQTSTAAGESSGWFHFPHWAPFGSYSQKSETNPQRNAWATRSAPPKPSPLQSVKNGAHRIVVDTKRAYHKTVAALTPGHQPRRPNPEAHVAASQAKPPFWKRMFGIKEQPQPPTTIPDFLAQKRIDP